MSETNKVFLWIFLSVPVFFGGLFVLAWGIAWLFDHGGLFGRIILGVLAWAGLAWMWAAISTDDSPGYM